MAIDDHNNDKSIKGIADVEHWVHKLFNKVYGYMTKNGLKQYGIRLFALGEVSKRMITRKEGKVSVLVISNDVKLVSPDRCVVWPTGAGLALRD